MFHYKKTDITSHEYNQQIKARVDAMADFGEDILGKCPYWKGLWWWWNRKRNKNILTDSKKKIWWCWWFRELIRFGTINWRCIYNYPKKTDEVVNILNINSQTDKALSHQRAMQSHTISKGKWDFHKAQMTMVSKVEPSHAIMVEKRTLCFNMSR